MVPGLFYFNPFFLSRAKDLLNRLLQLWLDMSLLTKKPHADRDKWHVIR